MQRSVLRIMSRRAVVASGVSASCSAMRCAAPTFTPNARASMIACPQLQTMRFYSGGAHEEQPTRSGQYLLDKNDVLTRVLEVVKNFEKVDASKVTPESHFVNDLGLNSLDVVEVVFAIEQEFILDIPDHDAEKLQSIPDTVEYIAQNPMAK